MTEKEPKYLTILPEATLAFLGPFDREKNTFIFLMNFSKHRVAFKIKTTAPDWYLVLPKTGFLDPGKQMEVRLVLRPLVPASIPHSLHHSFLILAHPASFDYDDPMRFWREHKLNKAKVQRGKVDVILRATSRRSSSTGSRMSLTSSLLESRTADKAVQVSLLDHVRHSDVQTIRNWLHQLERESLVLQRALEDRFLFRQSDRLQKIPEETSMPSPSSSSFSPESDRSIDEVIYT